LSVCSARQRGLHYKPVALHRIEADPAGYNDQFGRGPAKRRPTQVVEAQFAQPFLVATALVRVARRPKGSLSITVQRTDGRSVTVEARDPIGSPEKPLTNARD
jgi:hypothetical protein